MRGEANISNLLSGKKGKVCKSSEADWIETPLLIPKYYLGAGFPAVVMSKMIPGSNRAHGPDCW